MKTDISIIKRISAVFGTGLLINLLLGFSGCAGLSRHSSPPPAPPASRPDNRAEIYFDVLRANNLDMEGHTPEAIDLLKQSVASHPDSQDLLVHLIYMLIDAGYERVPAGDSHGYMADAESYCRDGIRNFPDNPAFYRLLADIYIDSRQYHAATRLYRTLIEKHPDDLDSAHTLARLYIQTSQFEQAQKLLDHLENASDDTETLKIHALLYGQEGKFPLAIRYYRDFLDRNPEDYEARYNLAVCYLNIEDGKSAVRELEFLFRNYPESSEVKFKLAEAYEDLGRLDDAISILEPMADSPQLHIVVRTRMARLLLKKGDPEQAGEILSEILKEDPNQPLAAFYFSLSLFDQGKYIETWRFLSARYAQRPLTPPVVDLMVQSLLKVDRIVDAIRVTERAIKEKPKESKYYMTLAELYQIGDHRSDVIRAYRRGLENLPDDKDLNLALAFYYEQTGDWEQGVGLIEKLLKKRQDDPELLNFAGYTLADHESRLDDAETMIRAALSHDADNAAYLDSLGWVLFRKGNYREAVKYLKLSISKSANPDPLIMGHLIEVYLEMGNREMAVTTFDEAIGDFPDDPGLRALESRIYPENSQ